MAGSLERLGFRRPFMRFKLSSLGLCFSALLAGCATDGAFNSTATPAATILGSLHGGQSSIAGAHVYLFAAGAQGYGLPSTSLLTASATGASDAIGAYVTSDANGNFALPGGYTCASSAQTYVLALGGNAGSSTNSAAGLLAAVGNCPSPDGASALTIAVNEITTIGTAYALAGFATDPTHVSSPSTQLALVDIQNAFLNAANLYSVSTGQVNQVTPAGNGQVPYKTINTLANILSQCIQSSGAASNPCSQLFADTATSSGIPNNTAAAAFNIAHNPGANTAALYNIAAANVPFGPALPAEPNDFTLGINFTGGGLNGPYSVAVDAEGSIWIANLGDSTVTKLASSGAPLSPAAGFVNGTPLGPVAITVDLSGNAWIVNAITSSLIKYQSSGALLSPGLGYSGGGISIPEGIATDALGNVWISNFTNSASKFSNGGTPISPAYGYSGGGIGRPVGIAIDSAGAVWLANSSGTVNSITKMSSAGLALSPPTGFSGGGLNRPFSVAIDNDGNAWAANYIGNSVTEFNSSGEPLSPSSGFTGGGLSRPFSIAVDGAGNAWAANYGNNAVSEFSNAGNALSPSTGYTGGLLNGPQAIAADGSGNIWVANSNDISVTELIGVSVPVVTPLAAGIKNNALGARP
jgi:hypothetical protein